MSDISNKQLQLYETNETKDNTEFTESSLNRGITIPG